MRRAGNAEIIFINTTAPDDNMNLSPTVPISEKAPSVWPKRVTKACGNCRCDKIRCDGSRPCGRCAKKGFTAEQCIDGCEPCRRARIRCEAGKPCRRCKDLNLECTDGTTLSVQHPLTPPPPSGKSNRVGDRVKLACSSCRRDNKKCDDQRPCSRCIARSQECIHTNRGPKLAKPQCEGCRANDSQCEESRPCKLCLESSRECVTLPKKGQRQGGRVKAACMACRRDKIRCNGGRPCTSCAKKGCPCIERPCQTCLQEGTMDGDCNHRRRAGELIPDNVKDTVIQTEPFHQRVLGPFHPPQSADQDSSPRPQWALFAPGPHSHPLHPMYPTLIPQPQYYFPPQPLPGHLIQLPFPMMPNSTFIPGPNSRANIPYNMPQVVPDPENHPMSASSSGHIID